MVRAAEQMVAQQIEPRGVRDEAVLEAMRRVDRARFVDPPMASRAFEDRPLPIGHRQTISQPYIVALMTELAGVDRASRVLEVGTGSGYQAAILAEIVEHVVTLEIVEPLGERARERLAALGYDNVEVHVADGYEGWPSAAPFDAILLAAAPPKLPEPLLEQLAPGGRIIAPIGDHHQELIVVERTPDGFSRRVVLPVRFVPMTGRAESTRPPEP